MSACIFILLNRIANQIFAIVGRYHHCVDCVLLLEQYEVETQCISMQTSIWPTFLNNWHTLHANESRSDVSMYSRSLTHTYSQNKWQKKTTPVHPTQTQAFIVTCHMCLLYTWISIINSKCVGYIYLCVYALRKYIRWPYSNFILPPMPYPHLQVKEWHTKNICHHVRHDTTDNHQ